MNYVNVKALEKATKEFQNSLDNFNKEANKHLKGYMYDSLIYRYKLARHKMTEFEIAEAKKTYSCRNYDHFISMEERDVMRFIEILDEAIGEHD